MILIAGGAFQGKKEFALELYNNISNYHPAGPVVADGALCTPEEAERADILIRLHEFIRRYPQLFDDPAAAALAWSKRQPERILVTNELGYGVVPVDPEDRRWREQCGRVCTAMASESRRVYRVVCGIGMLLKDVK